MIEALALAGANVEGALIRRQDGVALIATGLPLRIFNQVLVDGEGATPAAITSAVERTRERGDRFIVSLRTGSDDRFIPLMGELGLVPLSDDPWLPGMALDPLPEGSPATLPGYEIRPATDASGLEDHILTCAGGFEMQLDWLRAVMGPSILEHPDATVYVGYLDDQPVSTGLGLRVDRTIGIYNISTLPTARRRGYGEAMTMRIVADGAAVGCDVATLEASEMGYPIYARLGFRKVVDYMGYVEPASIAPAPAS